MLSLLLACCLSKPPEIGFFDPRIKEAPIVAEEPKPKLVINEETQVFLDGKACKFSDIPPEANVVSLEVAADRKTILKIYFQSK